MARTSRRALVGNDAGRHSSAIDIILLRRIYSPRRWSLIAPPNNIIIAPRARRRCDNAVASHLYTACRAIVTSPKHNVTPHYAVLLTIIAACIAGRRNATTSTQWPVVFSPLSPLLNHAAQRLFAGVRAAVAGTRITAPSILRNARIDARNAMPSCSANNNGYRLATYRGRTKNEQNGDERVAAIAGNNWTGVTVALT